MFELNIIRHKSNKYYYSIRLNGFIVEEYYDFETEGAAMKAGIKVLNEYQSTLTNLLIRLSKVSK